MLFAPAVLDKVYGGLSAKIAELKGFKKWVAGTALASGKQRYANGGVGASWLLNKVAFKKAQALLGGRVRACLSGSAPLAPEVQCWVQSVFNAPCRQGYGLTETSAGTTIGMMGDNTTGQVGPPLRSACIMLRDWAEGNYLSSDLDNPAIQMRRGEVLIGGPGICKGYFTNPKDPDQEVVKKNEEDFVTLHGVRFFCTGDIAQITARGCIQIIDRKKDLVKLQMGEYVALSKVENVLKSSAYSELPMVFALPTHSYCIALICPRRPALEALAKSALGQDLRSQSLSEICNNKALVDLVLEDVKKICKERKLAAFEIPKKLILVDELWTPETELLTAAMKLKRKPIVEKHQSQINEVYV